MVDPSEDHRGNSTAPWVRGMSSRREDPSVASNHRALGIAWFPKGAAFVGVDGYNRGNCSGGWKSFASLFAPAHDYAGVPRTPNSQAREHRRSR